MLLHVVVVDLEVVVEFDVGLELHGVETVGGVDMKSMNQNLLQSRYLRVPMRDRYDEIAYSLHVLRVLYVLL